MAASPGPPERPIRVLEFLTSTSVGGGPTHVFDLVTRLPRAEFTPLIAAPRDGSYFDRFLAAGFETHELPLNRVRPRTVARAVRLIRGERADLVHTHGKGAGLYGRLAARWARVPAVHTLHGIHYLEYSQGVRSLYLSLERALASMTQVIINVSDSQAVESGALRLVRPDQGVVIVNGVDVAHVRRLVEETPISRESVGLQADHLVVGCVTRFDHVKRIAVLFDVVARLIGEFPRLHLVLAGGGGEERALREQAARLGLHRHVTFLNFVPDAPRLLPVFDLYVSASSREGLPLSVLEAMAAGRPVVATRVPGHLDAVEDGVTGWLAKPDDPVDMAARVAGLLRDPALRARMGARGLERVRRLFSVERMVAETAAVYRRVMAGAAPATRERLRPSASMR